MEQNMIDKIEPDFGFFILRCVKKKNMMSHGKNVMIV